MQFTKLRLQGFKSFVDPTDLVIMDGLTGVVGPNGCGKSNLLEALRWVMGENRPTQMRGGGMEDVIFAGTDSRSAKHFAEVTLFMDNREHKAPAAFNEADELDVIRRITRDIGSAYKVNGKDARARDVAMMFADAATGSHSPSLVRQGQISELINAKPQARRRVLEDAAGISGLYQRRHEAELKLNAAEQNLLRVDDVLEQLATQMRSLERQARSAARYKEISANLRAAEALRAYMEWKDAAERALNAERVMTALRAERGEGERKRIETEKTLLAAQEKLPALRDEEAIAAALMQRLTLALENLSDEEARAHTHIAELARNSEALARDKQREMQIEQDAAEALKQLAWEESQIQEQTGGEEEAILSATETARIAAETLSQYEGKFDELRQNVAGLEARAQAGERRIKEANSRLETAKSALAQAEKDAENTVQNLAQGEDKQIQAQTALDTVQAQATKFATEISTLEEASQREAQTLDQLRADFAEAKGSLQALQSEERGLSGILAKKSDANPVLDQITVAKGYEAAFGAAFDDDLDAPLSQDASGWQARQAIEPSPWPAGAKPIAPHVKAPTELQNRLNYIAIIEPTDAGLMRSLKPGQRLVTQNGDLYRWDGYVRLKGDTDQSSALRLEQRNRLAELQSELETLEAKVAKLEADGQAQKEKAEAAKAALREAQEAERQNERKVTEGLRALHAAQNEVERLKARNEMLQSAINNRAEEVKLVEEELTNAKEAGVDPEELSKQKDALEAHRIEVEDRRTEMLEKRAVLEELRATREHRQKRLGDIAREKSGWNKRIENTSSHQSDLNKRIEDNEKARKEAANLPAELQQKRVLLEADIGNAQKRVNEAKEALAAGESTRAQADQAFRDAEASLAQTREKIARAETNLEAITHERDEASQYIREEYSKAPERMGEELISDGKELPPLEQVKGEINRLSGQREALGAVNLRAEEDRAEVVKEFENLEADKAEITQAIAKLRQAIAALNKEGRERLLEAFDEVNANFKSLFTKLFGGGSASLELIESDDPLNAGLEILCQPPGKKLATLSLLSGGEQTLTALSLIFAVFLTNPSPICVLDEVDAPLDDANVTRFCDMLDEMTKRTDTRFLIITHHAVTMARMDRLFGVTMAEKGVSQLVSVNLKEAEELVEA